MFGSFKKTAKETVDSETALQQRIARGEAAILHEMDLTRMQRDAILALGARGVLKLERDMQKSRTIVSVDPDQHCKDFWENPFGSLFAQLIFRVPSLQEIIEGIKKDYPGEPVKPSSFQDRRQGVFCAGCGD